MRKIAVLLIITIVALSIPASVIFLDKRLSGLFRYNNKCTLQASTDRRHSDSILELS